MLSTQSSKIQRKKYSHSELANAIALHERFRTGKPGGVRAQLAFADLSGMAMAGANLAEADCTGASFRGAMLSDCVFDRAALFACDFREADLEGASLVRADLRGACLRGANLTRANLIQADLREGSITQKDKAGNLHALRLGKVGPAELQGATLAAANLSEASMEGMSAGQADFTDAIMRDCKLARANLQKAQFTGANLAGADLRGVSRPKNCCACTHSGRRRAGRKARPPIFPATIAAACRLWRGSSSWACARKRRSSSGSICAAANCRVLA